jgi:hypothetical protein
VGSRRSPWIGVSVIVAVLAAATAIGASARPEAARNLLKNGGAEAGPGSSDVRTPVAAIPGWEAAVDDRGGQFNVLVYKSISPKDAQRGNFWPSTQASRLIKGGKKLFYGGYMAPGRTSSTLTQSVNVASQAKAIDAGKLSATLAAALGGVGNTNDKITVSAVFQNASGKKLGLIRIGPVPKEQWDKVFSNRGHSTALLERSATKDVPKNTRTIAVTLSTVKLDGANSDAIADNISLKLDASQSQH